MEDMILLKKGWLLMAQHAATLSYAIGESAQIVRIDDNVLGLNERFHQQERDGRTPVPELTI